MTFIDNFILNFLIRVNGDSFTQKKVRARTQWRAIKISGFILKCLITVNGDDYTQKKLRAYPVYERLIMTYSGNRKAYKPHGKYTNWC
jgi:menaquinone-dependent protoporphyrinogen IX oxidase